MARFRLSHALPAIVGRQKQGIGTRSAVNIMTYTALCSRIRVSKPQRTSSNVDALPRNPVPRALATTGALLDNVSANQAAGVHRKVPGALSLAAAAMMALNGAIVMPAVAGSLIAGEYIDPSHPGCERSIDDDGVVHGADAELPLKPGAACLPGAETLAWEVSGEISDDAMSIVVNFDKITKDKQGAVTGSWAGEGLELPSGLWTKKCVGWLCSCPLE